ncbi:unnamed protein product [Prunus brigantina]
MVPVEFEFELIKPCEGEEKLMDLNTAAAIPEEKYLLQQLQGSAPTPTPINVIGSEEASSSVSNSMPIRGTSFFCMALLTSIHGASTKGIIDWFNGAAISKQRLGGRRIGFCKRLRVDVGEDAEIMREESGYGWFLQGR